MHRVCVLIKDRSMQYEGLRTSLGLLLADMAVSMIVLDHEFQDFNEAYSDNLGFLVEMEGRFYSNHLANVKKYRFAYADLDRISAMLRGADLIIPF